uniref:C-CAP/cofactor C-like domain-containing protein n=1 Tax=Corethron hystrix TaxID=216773 RepID=A0A7S1G2C6_9STRA|mmetsp:Transcript_8110/g.17619  ORF Transcript_8110/g.17619 Transcript_8110/m.17619 type:complete len:353 (+) Transcript_8110:675-1733(+)
MFVIHRVRQVGSAEFWSNRIRKEYRNKDDEVSKAQITFCVKLSSLVKELSAYTKEWHTTGLAWGKGAALTKSAAQAGVDTVSAATTPTATATVKTKGAESKTVKAAPPVKSAADASEELKAALLAKTTGGNSAATGLKKVPRDQQTWRKEYKKDSATPAPASSAPSKAVTSVKAKSSSNKPPPPPKIEFHAPTNKWLVEHQVSPTQTPIVLTVDVTDLKHQVYIYKCTNVTVVVKGRFKNIIVDSCVRCNVIFDTVLISTEVFNGKSCKVQINGTCPSFVIDKTDGCQVYLSKETMAVTKFVTSKSSEMNVCWQDPSGDMKEVPIPEQFHHQLNPETGKISSEVSDLYTSNC